MNRIRTTVAAAAAGLAVTAGVALPAHAAPTTLIAAEGSTWRVWDQGPTGVYGSFQAPAFDDAGWETYTVQPGKVLGYGDVTDNQTPVLDFGGNSSFKHVVTYFRTTFTVSDPAAFDALTLQHLRDDGTVIHLNGVEVLRSNMPTGTLTSSTFSSTTVDGAAERELHTNVIPADALVAGTNVLAVQLHQRSDSSSDIALKLSLSGEASTEVPMGGGGPAVVVAGAGAAVAAAVLTLRRRAS